MTDTFEFTLNNPLTDEQWDMITDVDFDHTDRITFYTKHGKEVEFAKVRHGKWIPYKAYLSKFKDSWSDEVRCSRCRYAFGEPEWKYCPECGSRMDAE